jgi:hypothetical protein
MSVESFIDRNSLGATLDAVSASLFFHQPIPPDERAAIAGWIAERQGRPGCYADMFGPLKGDAHGFRLFTGEPVRSRVGIAHLLGEEACRVLTVVGVRKANVAAALVRAVAGMSERLADAERRGYSTSVYCCGTCSAGYWRNLALGLFPHAQERLRAGLAELKGLRTDRGLWRRFPFFYTSLALTEIGPDLARDEMNFAAVRWQRILPRLLATRDDVIATRRAAVGQRLLELSGS